MKTSFKYLFFIFLFYSCNLPFDPKKIEIEIPSKLPITKIDVLESLDWFANNVYKLIPEMLPEIVYKAYDQGLEIEFFETLLDCDPDLCFGGYARGLYYVGGRIELSWDFRLNDLRGTELIHELLHFLEDRVITDCNFRECNYSDNPSLQTYCEQHRCDYWNRFDSVLKYQYYLYITGGN